MSEVNQILETLKQLLKEKNITQYDVAAVLNLGVARVKQMFANQDFSMSRLSVICNELLGMEIGDLIQISQDRQKNIEGLTQKQEQQLVSDEQLLVVSVAVLNNWTASEIVERYDISEMLCRRHLQTLEKLKLITIRANGLIKLLIDQNFKWIPNGPLEQFFRRHIQGDFLDSRFDSPGEVRLFRTGMLTEQSADELIKKIHKMTAEFVERNQDDAKLELKYRTGYSYIVALRPWLMPSFTKFVRDENIEEQDGEAIGDDKAK